jgi:hypothetical protein
LTIVRDTGAELTKSVHKECLASKEESAKEAASGLENERLAAI